MDPSMYMPFAPAGLPQESKLVTYMRRAQAAQSNLAHTMGNLSLDSTPNAAQKPLTVNEFIPQSYYAPPPVVHESPGTSPPNILSHNTSTSQVHQENVGGTTYFYATNPDITQTTSITNAGQGLAPTFYMPDAIRSEILHKNEELYLPQRNRHYIDIPESVEHYTELIELEQLNMGGCLTSTYRVTHQETGDYYVMRRLHSYGGNNGKRNIEIWKNIDHPNIVRLHEVFTTKEFGDHSLIFVYDYHSGVTNLMHKYLSTHANSMGEPAPYVDPFSSDPDAPRPYSHQKNAMLRAVACGALLPEAELWSLLIQITAALRLIHSKGLACRSVDPTKVIMDDCRARLTWCGTADAVLPGNFTDAAAEVAQAQQEDLGALGRLALSLACRSLHAPTRDNLQASIELVSKTYSADFKNLVLYLLTTNGTQRRSVNDLMPMIGARFYTQVEALQKRADTMEDQLAREMDNGRLFRILSKLGAINERPELNMDVAWAETGDRYMLKLFRDYLFHAVTPDGRPWLNQAHIVYCLNHLDAGTNDLVQLMSRDEQSILVVSFAELKHCLQQAFDELMVAAEHPPT